VRLYPAKSTNSKEAMEALSDYFRAYSRPTTIVSDRGTCFTSDMFEEFLESINIKHLLGISVCSRICSSYGLIDAPESNNP